MTKSELHRLVDELPEDTVGATGLLLREIARRRIDPEQWWFWTPEWQRGEREAEAELAACAGTRYQSTEEFLRHLEQVPPAMFAQRADDAPSDQPTLMTFDE